MAIVTVGKKDLLGLVGVELGDEELAGAVSQLGMPVEKIEGDEFAVDITPDRPDMLCPEGLARAVSSFLGEKPGLRDYAAKESQIEIHVDESVKKVRPFIAAAVATGVRMDDALVKSLVGLQEKLHDTVGRKRRKVAIGFTDFSRLKPPFTYKGVGPAESAFVPLEQDGAWTPERILKELKQGKEYGYVLEGHKRFPLIVDSAGTVVALPPIITAEGVKITPSTKNVFVDVTGTSRHAVSECLSIICCALADRGAEICSVVVNDGRRRAYPCLEPEEAVLPMKRVDRLLGRHFDAEEAKELLERMGHGVEIDAKKAKLHVKVPPYRVDILHEVDLIEDIAIAFGYMNFAPSLPEFASIGAPSATEERDAAVREVMVGFGFNEVLAPYITGMEANFAKPMAPEQPAVRIRNPLTENAAMLRTWCVPSLLEIFAGSRDEKMPQRIFEVGDAVVVEGGKAIEKRKLAFAICDAGASFSVMKSVAESVLAEIGMGCGFAEMDSHPSFIPGRAAEILRNGVRVGFFGEVHPQVLNNFGIEQPVAAFEVELG